MNLNPAMVAQALGEALDKLIKEQQITNNHLSVIREQNYRLLLLLTESDTEAGVNEDKNAPASAPPQN